MQDLKRMDKLLELDEIMTEYIGKDYLDRIDEVKRFLIEYHDDVIQFITPTEEIEYPDDAPSFPPDGKHFQ